MSWIQRYFDAFVNDDEFVMGGGITEPNAGSDNRLPPKDDPKSGLQLSAKLDGDTWVLNGSKCYIANANIGKLIFAFARTDAQAPMSEGTTIFAVQRGTPGLKVGKVFNKHGWRFYQNAELFFENLRVADGDRLSAINGAHHKHGGRNSKFSDMEYAANAVGMCDAAIEMATAHGRTIRRAGKRLNEHQMFQLKLSEMHMLTEGLRAPAAAPIVVAVAVPDGSVLPAAIDTAPSAAPVIPEIQAQPVRPSFFRPARSPSLCLHQRANYGPQPALL